MARYRPPEYCIVCGKQLKAQYRDQSNIPVLQRIIGDTFMGYKKCDHKIEQPTHEGEKVEYDPFIEKHLGIIKDKMKESYIHLHIEKMWDRLEMASVEHFVQTGKVNGSFLIRLKELMDAYTEYRIKATHFNNDNTQQDESKNN